MREFLSYTWDMMKQNFKAQMMPFIAIRNWINYWANHKS